MFTFKRLGSILHIRPNDKKAIVRSGRIKEKILRKRVVDEKINHIGSVYDIFGPVDNPYIVIKLNHNIKNIKDLKGKVLYIYSKSKR